MRLNYYKKKLLKGTRHAPSKLNAEVVPKKRGLYAWFTKRGDRLIYIGIAIGKKGLYKRIMKQHLNPNYLETRTERYTSKDEFQLQHPIYTNGKIAIDKSAFRKNVARAKRLRAGAESVSYLRRVLNVSFLVTDALSDEEITKLEKELIAKLRPEFNLKAHAGK